MKRKFSKILGIGLTLSLLVSLLLSAAPVSADVSQPTVSLVEEEISVAEDYTISFLPGEQLAGNDTITIRFPDDTTVPEGNFTTNSFEVAASPGWFNGAWVTTNTVTNLNILGAVVGDKDDLTVVFSLTGTDRIGEGATVRIDFFSTADGVAGAAATTTPIKNPTEPGTYTLEVKTSEETTYVDSVSYDIETPTLGGSVDIYNPSGIKLATFGGRDALDAAFEATAGYFAQEDYVIKVGPGTYELDDNDITISGEGLTLESSDGAEETIIDCRIGSGTRYGIVITNKEVTVEGFTIDDADTAVSIGAYVDITVTNNVITDASVAGVEVNAVVDSNATVSNNVIEDCAVGVLFPESTAVLDLGDVDITGNTITEANTGGAIVFKGGNQDIDITGNTITGNECSGIYFANGTYISTDIDITGNTITLNEASGIEIAETTPADVPTDLVITGNDISANEDDGIVAATWDEPESYLMFNDIYDNDDDAVDNNSAFDVVAYFNWWGEADEDDFEDELEGDVDYEPWLLGAQATITSGFKAALGDADSLDAKTACDVKVSGIDDDEGDGADIISAFKYAANPQDDIDDAIAFYDVFIILDPDDADNPVALDEVNGKLKFYDNAINTGSVAHFWTGDFWAECSDQLARDGVVYVDLTEDTVPSFDELEGTPFVVVAGEAVTEFGAPALLAPAVGADDVSLTPTFAWGAVADAIGYDFEFADNANFVTPLVKLDGALGRLIVTAYAYVGELPYSTAYYWRVKAVSADEESDWASGVFITMDEPVEPTPPVVIEPYEPPEITIEQPDIIVQSPDVIVPLPAETPITPAWIYVIIGVGAVLVIALLVLIVRTRRVA